MDNTYTDFIKELKKNKSCNVKTQGRTNDTETTRELSMLLFNEIFHENRKKIENEAKRSILCQKEIRKDSIIFGIVTLKKTTFLPFVVNEDYNIVSNYKTKYVTKVIIIDRKDSIDNILLKSFDDKKTALKYAEQLTSIIHINSLREIIEIINHSLA